MIVSSKRKTILAVGMLAVGAVIQAVECQTVHAVTHYVGVDNAGFCPALLAIHEGDTVVWTNREPEFPHTTTSDLSPVDTNYWDGMMNGPSIAFTNTFHYQGDFTYRDRLGFGAGRIRVAPPIQVACPVAQGAELVWDVTGLTPGHTNVLAATTNLLSNWQAFQTNVASESQATFTNVVSEGALFLRVEERGDPDPGETGYRWTCQLPFPYGGELYGVSVLNESNVWIVGGSSYGGGDGVIVHYDGSHFHVQQSELDNALFRVCALDTGNVWAVGAAGTILHYDGTQWRHQDSGTTEWLYDVSAVDTGHVWAVGFNGVILHYNGNAWTTQVTGAAHQLRGVCALNASNVWAVGDQGAILYYNGQTWTQQVSGVTKHLRGVSAYSPDQVWAVGFETNILHFDGTTWSTQSAPGEHHPSVCALDATNVWAIDANHLGLVHYDGSGWSNVNIRGTFLGVSARDARHVWCVGSQGDIVFFDGEHGRELSQRQGAIRAVDSLATNFALAVGKFNAVQHFDGTGWTARTNAVLLGSLFGVSILDAGHAWAVGAYGRIFHYDGSDWQKQTSGVPSSMTFRGVDAVAVDHVWAVGDSGCIAHYDGHSWTTQVSGTTRALRAVSGCDPSHVWAVGEGGVILRWDGVHWGAQTSGVEYALYGVAALAPDQVWAVGAYGTILRWDGLTWTAQTSGVEEAIWSVSALDAHNAWAVCGEGMILRWDGRQWDQNRWRSRGKQEWWFWGLSAVSTDCVWAVGQEDFERGIIFQGQPGGRPVAVETVETPVYEPWIEPGETLPARMDLRGEMPPIKDQTPVFPGRQACQEWAKAYYQFTQWIKHFRRQGWDLTRPEYQMSPTFLRASSTDLIKDGCVDMADLPYDPSIPYCDTAEQREAAKAYRAQSYQVIWTNSGAAPYPDNNIETAKYWLAHGYVLSGSVNTEYGDFPDAYQTPPGAFYDPPGKPLGWNHEVVLCGYDDNINPSASDPLHRGGFLMANCWGDHWNGEMRGYVWFSYAWAKNYVPTMRVLFGNGPNGPAIMGCSPTNAIVGATVTIIGDGFGALRRQAGVTFNGVPAPVSSFSNETIQVTVPAGAASGPLIVRDWEGTASNAIEFQVDP